MNSEYNGFDNRNEEIAAYVAGEMSPGAAADFERRMVADAALRREVDATRAALDDARAWLGGEAPGIERVIGLEAPAIGKARGEFKSDGDTDSDRDTDSERRNENGGAGGRRDRKARVMPVRPTPRPNTNRTLRPVVRRILAAAAIFLFGFVAGRAGDWMRAGQGDRAGAPGTAAARTAQDVAGEPNGSDRTDRTDEADGTGKSDKPAKSDSPATAPPATAPHGAAGPGALAQSGESPRRTYSENGKLIIETTLADSGARALWVVDAGLRLDGNAR